MPTSDERIESASIVRAVLLVGSLCLLWTGLLAYLIFVVPKYEKVFAEQRMAIPRVTERLIEVSRWCVKYWYVVVIAIVASCVSIGAVQMAIRPHRMGGWITWVAWLLLALIPVAGLVAVWKFVADLPIAFRVMPNGEKHFEARSRALKASPEVEKEWHAQLEKLGLKDVALDDYLIYLDSLWDHDQRIRPEVVKIFCSRLGALDVAIIADWRDEFAKIVESPPSAANVASLLIQHERMFAAEILNAEEMRLIKGRLRAIPKSAIEKWQHLVMEGCVRRHPAMDNSFSAGPAMDLVRRDELFLRERWEADAFQSLCEEAKSRQRMQ